MRRVHGNKIGSVRKRAYICATCSFMHSQKPSLTCDFAKCAGTVFKHYASMAEARRAGTLSLLVAAGKIKDLREQTRLKLRAPLHETPDHSVEVCTYVLDFDYIVVETNAHVYEDVKGIDTEISALKRKWAEAQYGIRITLTK